MKSPTGSLGRHNGDVDEVRARMRNDKRETNWWLSFSVTVMAGRNKASSRNQVYMGACRCVKQEETLETLVFLNERKAAQFRGAGIRLDIEYWKIQGKCKIL